MKKNCNLRLFVVIFFVVAHIVSVDAAIFDSVRLEIDFSDAEDANAKAFWTKSLKFTNGDGLGVERVCDNPCWILSNPIPVGLSWRNPRGGSVSVIIEIEQLGVPREKKCEKPGDTFIRYSWDFVNWSTWAHVAFDSEKSDVDKLFAYKGMSVVPLLGLEKRRKLFSEFQESKPDWASDENEIARWIEKHHPDFLEETIPAIGYIQILHEAYFCPEQRIKKIGVQFDYGMGGMHVPRSPEKVEKGGHFEGRWNFKRNVATVEH